LAEYIDALEWIDDNFNISDYDSYDDYLDAIRDKFDNDNLIDVIEPELEEKYNSE
jgi:hypothetical protein